MEEWKKKRWGRLSQSVAVYIRYHRLSGQKSVQGTPIIIHCAEQRDVRSEFAAFWSPFQLHLSSVFHYRNLTPQVQRAWPENSPRQSSWLKDVTLGCELNELIFLFIIIIFLGCWIQFNDFLFGELDISSSVSSTSIFSFSHGQLSSHNFYFGTFSD